MKTYKLIQYQKWSLGLIMVLGSIFLLYINVLIPYLPGDDHIFQLMIPDEGIIGQQKILSITDLVSSQINFYNNYHYRVLNHTVLQVILLLPTWVFDVLNVVVYLSLPLCILPRSEEVVDYAAKYIFLLFFIWVFHFDLGRCYFLTTGSLNYTWLLIPQLLYISALTRHLNRKDHSHTLWLVLLAIANFNSNENVQIVLFVLTLYTLYKTKSKSVLLSAVVLLMGGLFMLLSPSIGSRLVEQGYREGGWLPHIVEYTKRAVFFGLQYWPIMLLAILAKKRVGKLHRELTLILLGGAALSMLVMIGIPLFEARSAVFGFFLAMMWLAHYTEKIVLPKYVFIGMLLLGSLVAILRLPDFQAHRARQNHNEQLLTSGKKNIYLEPYCDQVQRSYLLCYPLSADPTFIDNRSLAAVYDKVTVRQRVRKVPEYNLGDLSPAPNPQLLYARQDQTLDVFIDGTTNAEKYYIIRGSRKGINTHRLIDFMPKKWRLFFLDYLEDVTSHNQSFLSIEGLSYPHLQISNYQQYKYVLISGYDINLHDRVGEIKKLDLSQIK